MDNKKPAERAPAAKPFGHHIQYMNKIKARYPDDQSAAYKRFLEILQTYLKKRQSLREEFVVYQHREQRMMHNVQALFKTGGDLLSEFEDFLPGFASAAL
ncbi:hypothetical protein BC834DRAFT_965747 [Gloeopeniophorella convolvens]|nr:hypothetical protein BC834DRAFT_965747 [Gloeopeniophorella convolvens]